MSLPDRLLLYLVVERLYNKTMAYQHNSTQGLTGITHREGFLVGFSLSNWITGTEEFLRSPFTSLSRMDTKQLSQGHYTAGINRIYICLRLKSWTDRRNDFDSMRICPELTRLSDENVFHCVLFEIYFPIR